MTSSFSAYAVLIAAIICEVIGTTFLAATQQFTRFWPTLATALFYGASFYFLSISLAGFVFYRQLLDGPAIIGIALILTGVVVINLFSRSILH